MTATMLYLSRQDVERVALLMEETGVSSFQVLSKGHMARVSSALPDPPG